MGLGLGLGFGVRVRVRVRVSSMYLVAAQVVRPPWSGPAVMPDHAAWRQLWHTCVSSSRSAWQPSLVQTRRSTSSSSSSSSSSSLSASRCCKWSIMLGPASDCDGRSEGDGAKGAPWKGTAAAVAAPGCSSSGWALLTACGATTVTSTPPPLVLAPCKAEVEAEAPPPPPSCCSFASSCSVSLLRSRQHAVRRRRQPVQCSVHALTLPKRYLNPP